MPADPVSLAGYVIRLRVAAAGAILSHSRARLSARLLLLVLARQIECAGYVEQSLAQLCALSLLDKRTLISCVHELERLGELHCERRAGKRTRYFVLPRVGQEVAV